MTKQGSARTTAEAGAWAIEADHPDGGPWLYGRDGVSPDAIVASRLRSDGRYEHAVLDEYGMPIEWRTAIRPDLNELLEALIDVRDPGVEGNYRNRKFQGHR